VCIPKPLDIEAGGGGGRGERGVGSGEWGAALDDKEEGDIDGEKKRGWGEEDRWGLGGERGERDTEDRNRKEQEAEEAQILKSTLYDFYVVNVLRQWIFSIFVRRDRGSRIVRRKVPQKGSKD
jgi:hypothetical protein